MNKISNIDNLYLLDNKNIIIDNINFIGLTLPIKIYDNESNNLEEIAMTCNTSLENEM